MLKKDFYLVVSATRNRYNSQPNGLSTPRIVVGQNGRSPKTKAGEVAIKTTLQLPDSLFTDPVFKATISVDEASVTGTTVDAEVINNVKEIVSQATGLRIEIDVPFVPDEAAEG